MKCYKCDGYGDIEMVSLIGHVNKDMSIDAGNSTLEGEPLYQKHFVTCDWCCGSGEVSNSELCGTLLVDTASNTKGEIICIIQVDKMFYYYFDGDGRYAYIEKKFVQVDD